jgi:hypothetical protein
VLQTEAFFVGKIDLRSSNVVVDHDLVPAKRRVRGVPRQLHRDRVRDARLRVRTPNVQDLSDWEIHIEKCYAAFRQHCIERHGLSRVFGCKMNC